MSHEIDDPAIELRFPIQGESLPVDHGWPLYGALSRLRPGIHDTPAIRVGAVEGADWMGDGTLRLYNRSFLPIRLPASMTREVYPLAGKRLEINGHKVRLGVPRTRMLRAASSLHARIVVIANRIDWIAFEEELRRQLTAADILADIHPGKRRVMKVKGFKNIGFAVGLSGLEPKMSQRLLQKGIGGRKSMGAGFFVEGELPDSARATQRDLGLEDSA